MSEFPLEFDHCVLYREVRGTLRPMLNIAVGIGGISLDSLMLLDSGADNIVLPGKAMMVLGISPSDCKAASGSMYYGPSEAFWSPPLRISLPDVSERFSFETEVLFAPRLDDFGYAYSAANRL